MSEGQVTSTVAVAGSEIKVLCVSTQTATLDAIYIEMDTVRGFVGYVETIYDPDPGFVYYRAMPQINGQTHPSYPVHADKIQAAQHVASYALLRMSVEIVIHDQHVEYRRLHALRALGNKIDDTAMQLAAQTARGESHVTA